MLTNKEIADILNECAALIEKGWTKGANARDSLGYSVNSKNDAAICFCSVGAIERLTDSNTDMLDVIEELKRQFDFSKFGYSVAGFNDSGRTTRKQVIEMFKGVAEKMLKGVDSPV